MRPAKCVIGMSAIPADSTEPMRELDEISKHDDQETYAETTGEVQIEGEKSKEEQSQQDEETRAQTMTLDVAYKSLEMIRKVNLQVEFGREVGPTECVLSLRQARAVPEAALGTKSRFRQWVSDKTVSKACPCLTCGTPVSRTFRSPEFARQNITVCVDCAKLFSVDYLMKSVVHAKEDSEARKKRINHVLEVREGAYPNFRLELVELSGFLRLRTVPSCRFPLRCETGVRSGTFDINVFGAIHRRSCPCS